MPPAAARLAQYLLDDSDEPMASEVAGWLSASTQFRAFAEQHRDKIRKKLRGAVDIDSRLDVRTELRVAHLLLADRRIKLAFEASGSTRGGPDFTVSYRAHPAFNLEVTRLHRAADAAALGRVLLAKLRQLPAGASNVLLVSVTEPGAVIGEAIQALRSRVDARDDAVLTRGGFVDPRAFYQRFGRLGAVIAWCESSEGEARASAWVNSSARIAVPGPALRAALAALRDGSR